MSDLRTAVATTLSRTGICIRAEAGDRGSVHVHLSQPQADYLATFNRLVVTADLETAIVDRDGQAALCHWPGCGFYETRPHLYSNWKSLKPHSAHCPLAEEAR